MYAMKIVGCFAPLLLFFATKSVDAFVTGAAISRGSTGSPVQRTTSTCGLRMVAVGDTPPDFSLKDQNGEMVSLSSFKEQEKSVVVFFYPKDGTPGCTKEAQAFQADLAKFEELGAEVIGISRDEDHGKFVQDNGLSMTLLSDTGGKVRKQWKVKGAVFGTIDGRVTYVLDKNGVVTSMYDNLLDGAAHSKEAFNALQS